MILGQTSAIPQARPPDIGFRDPRERWRHPVGTSESEGRSPARLDVPCDGIRHHLVTIRIPGWTGTGKGGRKSGNMPPRRTFSQVGGGAGLPSAIP